MTVSPQPRRIGILVAGVLTIAGAAFTLAMGVLSLTAGHGIFSVGIATALFLWAVLVGGVGVALLAGRRWARGPVVAANLLHVFAYGEFALTEPAAIIGSLAALAAVVCAVLPSTRAALSAPTD